MASIEIILTVTIFGRKKISQPEINKRIPETIKATTPFISTGAPNVQTGEKTIRNPKIDGNKMRHMRTIPSRSNIPLNESIAYKQYII